MDEREILLSHSFEEIKGSELILTLPKLAQDLLGLPATDCENEHRTYYEKLKTINNKPMKQTDYLDKKYILKPGKVLYYNHTHFNNDTITDQIAANAIKKFPALIGAFLNERERAVLEAKVAATYNIGDAEDAVEDQNVEEQIIVFIDAEKFDDARLLAAKLLVEETREAAVKAIEAGEEKITEAAEKVKAEKKRLADEMKAIAKEAREKDAREKKAAADKKRQAEAKKKKEAEAKVTASKKTEAEPEPAPEPKPEKGRRDRGDSNY